MSTNDQTGAMHWDDLRPSVQAFAVEMEQKLRENDYKGGWDDCEPSHLLGRLLNEVAELVVVMIGNGKASMIIGNVINTLSEQIIRDNRDELKVRTDTPRDHIQYGMSFPKNEAVDVANFAMMIADNAKTRESLPEAIP